jgi:hypothetical protein
MSIRELMNGITENLAEITEIVEALESSPKPSPIVSTAV